MNRRNLGTSSGRREKAVDKSAMERMVRQLQLYLYRRALFFAGEYSL